MTRIFRPTAVAALLAAVCSGPAAAVVLIDTDFTAADGYVDGKLQFQNPNGSGNGAWLGQFNTTTENPSVDSVAGTVNVIGGSPGGEPSGDSFLRNIWNLGATGGQVGGGSDELGSGFSEGDIIKIGIDYQFTLASNVTNAELFVSGVTDCFTTCGFNAAPTAGIKASFAEFENGALKVYTNFGRQGFVGADNAFAVIIPGLDAGIDLGFNSETGVKDLPTDLESDMIRFSYEAMLTDESADLWTPTDLVIENLETATEIGRATIDNPAALETFLWNTEADDPFTPDVNEGGSATRDGSEMYFGTRWLDAGTGNSASAGGVSFEYLPNLPAVPGDYNKDGTVDAADYTVWRDSNETIGENLPADGTGSDLAGTPDGVVDEFDRTFWANNYGNPVAASSAIPEPSTLLLGSLVTLGTLFRRR